MPNNSLWHTTKLTSTFLDGVRGAIPGADLQLAVLGKIVDEWRPQPARIMDLGCGDGVVGRYLLSRAPETRALFVDFSDPMLDAARNKLDGDPRASLVAADFSEPGWAQAVAQWAPFDCIASGFAIHHQPDARKREIYSEIHDLLAPGGVFLNLEHVSSVTPAGEHLFDEFFLDHLEAFHSRDDAPASRAEIAETHYNRADKAENILAPLDLQCGWLREIGYQDVDCYFKVFELALFGGRKIQ